MGNITTKDINRINRREKIIECWEESVKILKIIGMALLITLAFFGLMSIVQAIPK